MNLEPSGMERNPADPGREDTSLADSGREDISLADPGPMDRNPADSGTVERLLHVRALLDDEGWTYEADARDVRFVVVHGGRKWRMAASTFGDAGVAFFAQHPHPVNTDAESALLRGLNAINLRLRRGCFLLEPSSGHVVCRVDLRVQDDYACRDQLRDGLMTLVAIFLTHWDEVGLLLCGVEPVQGGKP